MNKKSQFLLIVVFVVGIISIIAPAAMSYLVAMLMGMGLMSFLYEKYLINERRQTKNGKQNSKRRSTGL